MALFSFRKKAGFPTTPRTALPGRSEPIDCARPSLRDAAPDQAALSRGPRAGRLRPRLLLGRGAEVLADRAACGRRQPATRAA